VTIDITSCRRNLINWLPDCKDSYDRTMSGMRPASQLISPESPGKEGNDGKDFKTTDNHQDHHN